MRINDLKVEAKATDSTLIYKFNTTYTIKQLTVALHEIKGVKVIKTINVYVNNKQGVDLAEMRNNWSYWRKVSSLDIKIA